MTKQEVAEFLGVSTRAVERYVAAGKFNVSYLPRAKGGQDAVFDKEEVEKFKISLSEPKQLIPRKAEEKQSDASLVASSSSRQLIDNIEIIAKSLSGQVGAKKEVVIENKMMLTLEEAALLSGAPIGIIKGAVKGGDLKGVKLGRTWRVKREDLEAWVKGL